jgi:ankyrin repeat protein
LHLPAIGGHKEPVELLIAKGANLEAKDNSGDSPLLATLSLPGWHKGASEVIDVLLTRGADISATNHLDRSVLAVAVRNGRGRSRKG